MRAFYGALVGAFLVLLSHPSSRPYVVQGLWFSPQPELKASGDTKTSNTLLDHARFLKIGLSEVVAGYQQTDEQTRSLLAAARRASVADPDNAFWKQSEAALQEKLGDRSGALVSFRSASYATRWRDYDVESIQQIVNRVAAPNSKRLAWHSALEESFKTSVNERANLALLRRLVRNVDPEDLDMRLIIFRNAKLVRDGSRSVEGSLIGLELMELAAFGPGNYEPSEKFPGMFVSPKTQAGARSDFATLASARQSALGDEIQEGYQRNDAWIAFINVDDSIKAIRWMTLTSIVCSALPGALVSIGVLGAIVLGIGAVLRRSEHARRLLTPPWTILLGVLAGTWIYLTSGLVFPAVWATASLASFSIRPEKNREGVPGGYSSAYRSSLVVLAASFSIIMALFLVTDSPAGGYLGDLVGLTNALPGSRFALVSLSAVVVSLAMVTGSVWGFLMRVPSEKLAAVSLERFGTMVALGCFAAGILIAPPAIAVDKIVGDRLDKIFQNEPNYYLTR